jgi:hypothetical protein
MRLYALRSRINCQSIWSRSLKNHTRRRRW